MTVLVDSWAWIEYFKGSPNGEKAKKFIDSDEEIIVSSINIAEIYNFLLNALPDEADNKIDFVIHSSFVVPLSAQTALLAGKNKHLKKLGMADAIVLATARLHNAKILTGDADFRKEDNIIFIGEN
ncbi:type II toxin-antitoxin system VapC family toxin [Candidatus Woesearchaeota archaeon]|nr:type II toxin-antitoxin system VapC family toxin [Candidatus Woesearchaeota archaeon]